MGVEERNARLDALQEAAVEYADKKRELLQNQAAFAKRVLQGRTGSERLNNESVQAATELVVDEIIQFLEG